MGEAIEAIRRGDPDALRALLEAHPELANAQAVRDETLLGAIAQPDVFGSHLRAELGVDARCVQVLVDAGADLDVPLQIASCFDRVELVGLLLAAGGRAGARDVWGITAFETAIYHGAHQAADVLAAHAPIEPPSFWVYAGLGRIDLLEGALDASGRIREEARRERPNLADVGWNPDAEPPDDEATLLAEGLTHAARNGRYAAVEWLLEHGADVDAGPFQGLTRCTWRCSRPTGGWSSCCSPAAPTGPAATASTTACPRAGSSTCGAPSPSARCSRDLLDRLGDQRVGHLAAEHRRPGCVEQDEAVRAGGALLVVAHRLEHRIGVHAVGAGRQPVRDEQRRDLRPHRRARARGPARRATAQPPGRSPPPRRAAGRRSRRPPRSRARSCGPG